MADRDKSRIFAVQKAHNLNSCILISNNLSKTRPSVRTGGFFCVGKFFGVGKRCFLCRQTFLASYRSVSTQNEGQALGAYSLWPCTVAPG